MSDLLACARRIRHDVAGAVLVEKLIAVPVLLLFFFSLWQMAELGAAHIVVNHASATAGRAAVVVLPDIATFYGQQPVHSYGGQRRDDIYLATGMILAAAPQIRDDFEVQIENIPEGGGFQLIDVTVRANFQCGRLFSVVCGADGVVEIEAKTQHAYQGAQYKYSNEGGPVDEFPGPPVPFVPNRGDWGVTATR